MQQASAAQTTANSGGDALMPLRACNTAGCKVATVVDKTKRKCCQFVSTPYILPKPLVVNGHTSIFQVGGKMAKMCDIPSISQATGGDGGQPIYRIKPGTHAHVINYVLIDDSDSLEKSRSGDQEAMRLLLDSQRDSAVSKLQKLIANHRGTAPINNPVSTPTNNPVSTPTPARPTVVPSASPASRHVTTPQIHPDFSIASVEGSVPFRPAIVPPAAPPVTASTVPVHVDRLQAELMELRRKVARLEETPRR
ncbi:uncharacterized protein Boh2 [Drosophila kikkawai]|uniref:Uncharacterized protein Boh2 n=1 Tax=Drosophila kikkawai TaxID=30033 RepID=A0A6P4JDL2_DROKI|nr:uncharacterized protein LOC108081977 [Drosophila kikkawai]